MRDEQLRGSSEHQARLDELMQHRLFVHRDLTKDTWYHAVNSCESPFC